MQASEITSSSAYHMTTPLAMTLAAIMASRWFVDLAKMPHLLVAGTTGSGKSVGINAMTLLYKSEPDQVRSSSSTPRCSNWVGLLAYACWRRWWWI